MASVNIRRPDFFSILHLPFICILLQNCRNNNKNKLKNEQYEKAWEYKNGGTAIYYASEYYEFMNDVVTYLCDQNKKNEARTFVNKYSQWFKMNVDNLGSNVKSEYRAYYYSTARNNLLKTITEY